MGVIIMGLLWLAMVIGLGYGYIINIVWMVQQQTWLWNGESILSIVGVIIPPLGIIMGYVH